MNEPDLESLVDAYFRHHSQHRDEDFWAWQEVQRIVESDLKHGWELLLLLLTKSPDEALGYVAAGPLEDFVDIYGDAGLDIIEAACDGDSRLQYALSGIWLLPESPVLVRFQILMKKYGFYGKRDPLSRHPDCWS